MQNDLNAFVEYSPGNSKKPFNYLIKYEIQSRLDPDQIKKYSISLYDSLGGNLKNISRSIIGNDAHKDLCKGINLLLEKKFSCKADKDKKKITYWNISFKVHKIDSALYSITAQGAGIRPLKDVKEAFLKKAGQYLNKFDYYFESGKYIYDAPSPYGSTGHEGYEVYGIIKPFSESEISPHRLKLKPAEFIEEFNKTQ